MRRRACLFLSALFLLGSVAAQARSGCCSHHGGVCGCSCCDGSPVSAVCYDPNCGQSHFPTTPSRLSAVATAPTSAQLSWLDESSDETGFRIESRTSTESSFGEVAVVPPNTESYRVSSLEPDTTYFFRVAAVGTGGDSPFSNESTVTTPNLTATCTSGATTLCLGSGRFQVQATYSTSQGQSGAAHVVALTSDTGYLWFFNPANVEVVVKVLDGCSLGGYYWVFAGGLTNVLTVLTVTDLQSGAIRSYTNPQGKAFQPIQDTNAFATCP